MKLCEQCEAAEALIDSNLCGPCYDDVEPDPDAYRDMIMER